MSLAADLEDADAARGQRKAREELDRRKPIGLKMDGKDMYATIDVEELPRDERWDYVLEKHPALDPDLHEIDESFSADVTMWQMGYVDNDGEAQSKDLYRVRVKVKARRPGERLTKAKIDELIKLVRKRVPSKIVEQKTDNWLVFNLADWQTGKADFGGTPALLERLELSFAAMVAHAKRVKPAGICMVDLGDICEQVSCFYDSQTYTVDLNLTEQMDLVIELIISLIDQLLNLTPRIIFGAVPSNHGEFRVAKGTVMTDRARDNIDLVVANAVSRILAANPERYGHVEVWTPPKEGGDPFVLTLDLDGVMVGFTHGHQVPAMGPGRMASLEKWWFTNFWTERRRLRTEKLPTGADCDILVTGHGHTLMLSEQGGRLLVQCPAAESGSEYFSTSTGKRSSAGTLTFETSPDFPMNANNFRVL